MAIQVRGKITDHLIGAFIKVTVEKGWDYAEKWLHNQGIDAKRVVTIPQQLPPSHSYSYYTFENGYYCWHFVDSQRNTHVKYIWTPQGWVGPYQ